MTLTELVHCYDNINLAWQNEDCTKLNTESQFHHCIQSTVRPFQILKRSVLLNLLAIIDLLSQAARLTINFIDVFSLCYTDIHFFKFLIQLRILQLFGSDSLLHFIVDFLPFLHVSTVMLKSKEKLPWQTLSCCKCQDGGSLSIESKR